MRRFQYNLAILLASTLSIGCGKLGLSDATSNWSPPTNPDPHQIYRDAQNAIKSGDHTNALLTLVWFHENALNFDEALAGVRLSYALSDWADLGKAYPPALDRLNTVRDKTGQKIKSGSDSNDYFQLFMDFTSINEVLNEDAKSKDLFLWLDANKSDWAKEVYALAEPALIKSKDYVTCGKYIDPEARYASALSSYRTTSEIAKNSKHGKRLQDWADKKLKNEIATLIALLVSNGRTVEATEVAEKLAKEGGLPDFKLEVGKALTGEVPAPWP